MTTILKAAIAAATVVVSAAAHAEDTKNFNGPYVGAEIGYVNAEAGIDGLTYGGFAGYRLQLDNNIVVGAEGTFGSADITNLDHIWSIGGTIGLVVGAEKAGLAYLGLGYVEAKASVAGVSAKEDDYVVKAGYEHVLTDTFSIRGQASTNAFDDAQVTLGVIARF